MRRLVRWLAEVATGGAILLLGRWSLRVSRPGEDLATIGQVCERITARLREAWTVFWRAYGPITGTVRSNLEQLRTRFQGGAFGPEGT